MATFKAGDQVKIVDREMNSADIKSGLFYDYFRNLTGIVDRIYEEDKTVCVKVDLESLPVDIQKRHKEVQNAVRTRWLNGLGQEARDRLSETDRTVVLGYNILLGLTDIEPMSKAKAPAKPASKPVDTVHRATEKDIEKAEEEHLKNITNQ